MYACIYKQREKKIHTKFIAQVSSQNWGAKQFFCVLL
jgi:hypothetical protein